jgi:GT2 family glycosyltransferase
VFWTIPPDRPWFTGSWRGQLPGTFRARKLGDPARDVDYLWACCLYVGADTWRRVGPFDERYFLYYEDLDWCERARAAGVALRMAPEARLWHAVGASTGGPDTPLRRYHLSASSVRFFRGRGPAALLVRALVDGRTALVLAASGRRELLAAHLSGWRDGVRRT